MGQMPVVYVCCGSRCKGRKKARKALVSALESVARVEYVDCQKICSGPVAGFEVAGKLEWFSDLRKDKARRKLLTLVEEGKLTKALQKRWVKKRSGKKRGRCGEEDASSEAVDASGLSIPADAPSESPSVDLPPARESAAQMEDEMGDAGAVGSDHEPSA